MVVIDSSLSSSSRYQGGSLDLDAVDKGLAGTQAAAAGDGSVAQRRYLCCVSPSR